MDNEEISNIYEKLSNVHYVSGITNKNLERMKAYSCMKTNELEAIYHLVESHVPELRMKTALRYEKILTSSSSHNVQLSLCKNYVTTKCRDTNVSDNLYQMLEKIKDMPPEWTIVQLTPHHSSEAVKLSVNKHSTNNLYITVFSCGQNQPKPFCVSVDSPKDPVTGEVVPLMQEVHSIMGENRNVLNFSKVKSHFDGVYEKKRYYTARQTLDNRLKASVKDFQDLYLKQWKCLLIGKYTEPNLENKIHERIKQFFKTEASSFDLNEKTECIIKYLIKGAFYLKLTELKEAIQFLIPGISNKLQKQLGQFIIKTSEDFSLPQRKKHPLILVIDDSLDFFPWEMMDVLVGVTVSRLPSLYLVYALFQEHRSTIKNGFKILKRPENGTYVVNADLDLNKMQNRILSFYEYWLPSWKGVAGCKPTEEQFQELLASGEIFSYNGHGSGCQFIPMFKVEKFRIEAVVLLFGCSSTKLNILGPEAEMYSAYHVYLIACSPCIIGNLWEVTDLEMDTLATEFLSLWIPNNKKTHWKKLDKTKWKKGDEKVTFESEKLENATGEVFESELLKALSTAKTSNSVNFYITKAAIVARGIPVKISTT